MDPTDADLVLACRRGDEAAWELLVQRYKRLVYAIPRRAGLSDEAVADVFQRTFVALVEHLDTLQQPERLSAWLATTARRESWRLSRSERMPIVALPTAADTQEDTELVDSAPLPDEQLLWLEQQHEVRTALATLDERCRTLLTLLFYREDPPSYTEIAEALGTSAGSIGPTRARCLEKLRARLNLRHD